MAKRLWWSLIWGLGAYAVGVAAGVILVAAFSGNRHDRDLEMVMTGFFFVGPIVGGLGVLAGLLWSRRA